MSLFNSDYTIGVEEELLLVDARSGELSPTVTTILDRICVDRSTVDFELYAAQLEVRSGICNNADAVLSQLRDARWAVARAGATVIGCGVHPTGRFGAADILDTDRYRAVTGMFAGLVARTPEAALHVHVGLPDDVAAVRAFNGLREYLPVFIALTANSPWWFGRDSGLASARYSLVRPYPTRRVPDRFPSYEEYARSVEASCSDVGLADPTFVYWDLRLHPRYGTVEIREMDSQCSPAVSAGVAALIQAVTVALVEGILTPEPSPQDSLTWACFLASRDGLTGPSIPRGGGRKTLAEDCRALMKAVRSVSRSLGGADAVETLEGIVREGNGAARQRRAVHDGGSDGLLHFLIEASNGEIDGLTAGPRTI